MLAVAGAPGQPEEPPRARIIGQPVIPLSRRLARGREWDLSGSQAIHPVPMPRSRTPAGSTRPRHGGRVDAAPAPFENKGSSVTTISRLTTGLWHLLSTLHERCCHRPCKTRFRLAGWPLPGGRRTLWIAMKGFRFYISSPFPGFILTRRRLVLDGSEHSRTMIESGGQTAARSQAARAKPPAASWSSEKRKHDLSAHRTQTDAATIATRRPRPAPRGSVARAASGPRDRAWPDRREGAAQILRIRLCKTCTLD